MDRRPDWTYEITQDPARTRDQKFGRMGDIWKISRLLFGKSVVARVVAGVISGAQPFFIDDEFQCEITGVFVVQAVV